MKKFFRRIVCVVCIIAIIGYQYVPYIVLAAEGRLPESSISIITTKFHYLNQAKNMDGRLSIVETIPDLNDGILLMMDNDPDIYENYTCGEGSFQYNSNIYAQNSINIPCKNANLTQRYVAENDVIINCSDTVTGDSSIIYAKTGDIELNAKKIFFGGIIYAPHGKVIINAEYADIAGLIIADEVEINCEQFFCNSTDENNNLLSKLELIRNDTALQISIDEEEDGKYILSYDCNKKITELKIYIRVDKQDEFVYYCTLDNSMEFEFPNNFTYLDVAAEGITTYGETGKSNVLGFDVYEGNIEIYYCDTDHDKIMDGEEVWLTGTNPYLKDTDGEGFDDYTECFILYSDPLSSSIDYDSDHDGLTNKKELELMTDPHLADSDFDGIPDGKDAEPYVPNSRKISYDDADIIIGPFDTVVSYFAEDGSVCQKIYNPITGLVKR